MCCRPWFPFFPFLVCDNPACYSDIVWSKDFSVHFFCFLSILDWEFLSLFFLPIFDRELSFSFAFFRPLVGNFLFSLLLSSDLWPRTFYFSLFLLKHICSLTVNGSSFLGDTFVPSFVGKKEKIPILGQGLWPMS